MKGRAQGSESNRNRNRSRGDMRRSKGMEGLQVSFFAGFAEEVAEALLLDAPQDAAHHRRHGCRRRDDSPAGPERREGCGVVGSLRCSVRPSDSARGSSRRHGLAKKTDALNIRPNEVWALTYLFFSSSFTWAVPSIPWFLAWAGLQPSFIPARVLPRFLAWARAGTDV